MSTFSIKNPNTDTWADLASCGPRRCLHAQTRCSGTSPSRHNWKVWVCEVSYLADSSVIASDWTFSSLNLIFWLLWNAVEPRRPNSRPLRMTENEFCLLFSLPREFGNRQVSNRFVLRGKPCVWRLSEVRGQALNHCLDMTWITWIRKWSGIRIGETELVCIAPLATWP